MRRVLSRSRVPAQASSQSATVSARPPGSPGCGTLSLSRAAAAASQVRYPPRRSRRLPPSTRLGKSRLKYQLPCPASPSRGHDAPRRPPCSPRQPHRAYTEPEPRPPNQDRPSRWRQPTGHDQVPGDQGNGLASDLNPHRYRNRTGRYQRQPEPRTTRGHSQLRSADTRVRSNNEKEDRSPNICGWRSWNLAA